MPCLTPVVNPSATTSGQFKSNLSIASPGSGSDWPMRNESEASSVSALSVSAHKSSFSSTGRHWRRTALRLLLAVMLQIPFLERLECVAPRVASGVAVSLAIVPFGPFQGEAALLGERCCSARVRPPAFTLARDRHSRNAQVFAERVIASVVTAMIARNRALLQKPKFLRKLEYRFATVFGRHVRMHPSIKRKQ